ncbi:MAG TPA: threonine dehydratase [Steroidobacteraceae bacterium]|nr:threonine dehydratase [Steroidobacteraceae bacterium]
MFTLEDLEQAAELIRPVVAPTPQYPWPKLAARAGCRIWVKHENHTPTGAFKVRGGLVYMNELVNSGTAVHGVISATRGNHGQSISFAANRVGIPATIYVPHGNSPDQNASMRSFGATVVEFGDDFDQARVEAARMATERKLHFVPAFHPTLVKGVATYALELFRAAGDLDAVYVPIGMGSGICGMIAARDLLGLRTHVIGVVAEKAPAMALSFAAGKPVSTPTAKTFADGVATREPQLMAVQTILRGAERIVQVTEDEIAAAMRDYFDDSHQVVEGAGAASLAALLKERDRWQGKSVAVVASGGNIERARYQRVLNGETPQVP